MTNHWIDIKHSDCIMIIGSNAAENHPVSFKWVNEARAKRGASSYVLIQDSLEPLPRPIIIAQ